MSDKNTLYWAYNLPLQVWFEEDEDGEQVENGDIRLLNYMPRRERVESIALSDVIGDQTREEFFNSAASYFENLAKLMRNVANGNNDSIYYHDEGMHDES